MPLNLKLLLQTATKSPFEYFRLKIPKKIIIIPKANKKIEKYETQTGVLNTKIGNSDSKKENKTNAPKRENIKASKKNVFFKVIFLLFFKTIKLQINKQII